MPSSTFYRLPIEKRDKITKAIISELSLYDFSDVSVNRIIKDAEISRGSFYQYFEDKEEMLVYVIEEMKERLIVFAKECLRNSNGDIFSCFENAIQEMWEHIKEKEKDFGICKKLFSDSGAHRMFRERIDMEPIRILMEQEIKYFHENNVDKELLWSYICIMFDVLAKGVLDIFAALNKGEEFKAKEAEYRKKIQYLKQGYLAINNK